MTEPTSNDPLLSFSLSRDDNNVPSVTSSCSEDADMATNSIKLLTGNSHPDLAKAVAKRCAPTCASDDSSSSSRSTTYVC